MIEGLLLQPTLRAFVALEMPELAIQQLERTQKVLDEAAKQIGVRLRLTARQQLHITLAFLGNVVPAQVQPIVGATQQVAARYWGCQLAPRGLVAFPSARQARVIAITLEENSSNLSNLVSALHDRLRQCGCSLENRAFCAHVTFGALANGSEDILR